MTRNTKNLPQNNQCPKCGKGRLYFSANGQVRECEDCHYQTEMLVSTYSTHSAQKLKEDTAFLPVPSTTEYRVGQANNLRISLVQGIEAAKAGNLDEAYSALTRVLQANWDEDDRLTAWLWLSKIVVGEEAKRFCLEQVLALETTHALARQELAVLEGQLHSEEIIDPDKLDQKHVSEPIKVGVEQFVCPQCTGQLIYSPDDGVLFCEFCHFQQELEQPVQSDSETRFGEGKYEKQFEVTLATAQGHLKPIHTRTFLCHNCAIEFILSPETISLTCPYCSAVYVTESVEFHEIIPPHGLIPFHVNEDKAKSLLHGWFKKNKINRPNVAPLVGIYSPIWTFDIGGQIKWSQTDESGKLQANLGRLSQQLWPTRPIYRANRFVISNSIQAPFFNDIPVSASNKLPQTLAGRLLEDFDSSGIVGYDDRYLANWPAERYQLPLSNASIIARRKALKKIRTNAYSIIKKGIVPSMRLDASGLIIESFKQILLPIWVTHYKFENQVYDIIIDGQTGIIYGHHPQGKLRRFISYLLGTYNSIF